MKFVILLNFKLLVETLATGFQKKTVTPAIYFFVVMVNWLMVNIVLSIKKRGVALHTE